MTEEYKINFIKDEPTENSDFSAHANIAKTIYEIIKGDGETKNEEKNGKSIALFGSWGSGKSTVIKTLEKIAKEKKDNIDIFEFDAWEHSNSPIKRAFLEELLKFLRFKHKKIKEIKTNVDERQYSLEIKDKPRIDTNAICLTILYAYTMYFGQKHFPNANNFFEAFFCNFWITLAFIWPIFIIIPYALLNKHLKFMTGNNNESKERITKTSEPSGIEFKEYFKHIMAQYGKEKKLVIVIDNLDRVPEEKAENILSNLSSFTCNGYKNVWSIIPIDKNHALKLWGKYQNKENFDVNSFIEKLFNLKFYLNHAIHSDAKKYFTDKLNQAFEIPKLSEEEKDIIYDIYISEYDKNGKSIRKMVTYINDLASLFLLHPTINIKILALYCRKKEQFKGAEDFRTYFNKQKSNKDDTDLNFSDEKRTHKIQMNLINNDESFPADFASIFFGVDKKHAVHCLYGDIINFKLRNGEYDNRLEGIINNYGFIESLNDEIKELKVFQLEKIEIFFNTIFVLSKIETELKSKENKAKFKQIWDKFNININIKDNNWPEFENINNIIWGLNHYLSKSKKNISEIKNITNNIFTNNKSIDDNTSTNKILELIIKHDPKYYIKNINKNTFLSLTRYVKRNNKNNFINLINKTMEKNNFNIFDFFDEEIPELIELLKIKTNKEDIFKYISSVPKEDINTPAHIFDYVNLISYLEKKNNINLQEISNNKINKEKLYSYLYMLYEVINQKENEEIFYSCLSILLRYYPIYVGHNTSRDINVDNGAILFKDIIENRIEKLNYKKLISDIEKFNSWNNMIEQIILSENPTLYGEFIYSLLQTKLFNNEFIKHVDVEKLKLINHELIDSIIISINEQKNKIAIKELKDNLSEKDIQMIRLLRDANWEIARKLNTPINDILADIEKLKRKFYVDTKRQILAKAIRLKII